MPAPAATLVMSASRATYPPNEPLRFTCRPANGPVTSTLSPGRSLNSRNAGTRGRRTTNARMRNGLSNIRTSLLQGSDAKPESVSPPRHRGHGSGVHAEGNGDWRVGDIAIDHGPDAAL